MKKPTMHINPDWAYTPIETLEKYTACGAASNSPKYWCTGDPEKVTCKKCRKHNAMKKISQR